MISRKSRAARLTWIFAYTSLLIAGIAAFFSPSQVVEKALVEFLVYGWATFLTAGALLCLGGKIRNTWAGEIIGLPLISTSGYTIGILLLCVGTGPAAFPFGVFFCGVGAGFIGRWMEIHQLAKGNQEVNRDH